MDVITLQKKNPFTPTTDPLKPSNNSDSTNPLNQQLSHPGTYKDTTEENFGNSHFLINPQSTPFHLLFNTDSVLPLDDVERPVFGPEPSPNDRPQGSPIPTQADPLTGSPLKESHEETITDGFGNDTDRAPSLQSSPNPQDVNPSGKISPETLGGTFASGLGRFITETQIRKGTGSFRGLGQILGQSHSVLETRLQTQKEIFVKLLTGSGRDPSRFTFEIFGAKGGPVRAYGPFRNQVLREGEELVNHFTDAVKGSSKGLKALSLLDQGLQLVSFGLAAREEYTKSDGNLLSSGAVGFANALPTAAVPQLVSLGIDVPFSIIDEDQNAPSIFDGVVGNGARYAVAIGESLVTRDSTPITTLVDRIDAGETGGFAQLSADSGRAVGESFFVPAFTLDFNDFDLEPIQTLTEELQNGKYGVFGKVAVYTTPQGLLSTVFFGTNGLFGK